MVCEKCGKELIDSGLELTEELLLDKEYIDSINEVFNEEYCNLYNNLIGLNDEEKIKLINAIFILKINQEFLSFKLKENISEVLKIDISELKNIHIIDKKIFL